MNKKMLRNIFVICLTLGLAGCAKINVNNIETTEPSSSIEQITNESVILKPDVFRLNEPLVATSINGHNLSLESSVEIVYYVKNNVEYVNSGLLVWKNVTPSSFTYENAQYKLKSNTTETISEVTYDSYYFDGVAAKEMTIYVYAVSYVYDGNEYTYSEVDRYSILNYCNKYKDSTVTTNGGSKTLGEMIAAIVDFGTISQLYFNYKVDRLPSDTYHRVTLNGGHFADGFNFADFTSKETIIFYPDTPENEYETFHHWELHYERNLDPIMNNYDGIVNELETNLTAYVVLTHKDYRVTINHCMVDAEAGADPMETSETSASYDFPYTFNSYVKSYKGLRFVKFVDDEGKDFVGQGTCFPFMRDVELTAYYEYITITYNLIVDDDHMLFEPSTWVLDITMDIYKFSLATPIVKEGPLDHFLGWYYGDEQITDAGGHLIFSDPFNNISNQDDIVMNLTPRYY